MDILKRSLSRAFAGRGVAVRRGLPIERIHVATTHHSFLRRPRRPEYARDYHVLRGYLSEAKLQGFIDDFYEVIGEFHAANTVMTGGVNALVTSYFKNGAPPAAWYVGLIKGAGAPVFDIADTMAGHAGWTEVVGTDVAEATRPVWTAGAVAAGACDNNAAKVRYTGAANFTARGLFLVSANDIGGGTGVLYCGAAYTEGAAAMQVGYMLDDTVGVGVTAG
jgi:hypothetical protein